MKRVILLNGPPRSGKDTAAELINKNYGALHLKFAGALKTGVHMLLGLTESLNPEHYAYLKDRESDEFFGLKGRDCYIDIAENYMKPRYGEEIFGHVLVRELEKYHKKYPNFFGPALVISDSGFEPESRPVIKWADKVLLLYLNRGGCDFVGDSRSYWSPSNPKKVECRNISNNESIKQLGHYLKLEVDRWLKM